MKYTIEELQCILNVSDEIIIDRLNITKQRLKTMKERNEKEDFKRVKAILVHERAKVIRYLK